MQIPFVNMLVASLKGVGSIDPINDDVGSLILTVIGSLGFFCCPVLSESVSWAYHPLLPFNAFALSCAVFVEPEGPLGGMFGWSLNGERSSIVKAECFS